MKVYYADVMGELKKAVLKSDHDREIKKKDLEIKMLREQRNHYIEENFSEDDDSFVREEVNHLDQKIQSALSKLSGEENK